MRRMRVARKLHWVGLVGRLVFPPLPISDPIWVTKKSAIPWEAGVGHRRGDMHRDMRKQSTINTSVHPRDGGWARGAGGTTKTKSGASEQRQTYEKSIQVGSDWYQILETKRGKGSPGPGALDDGVVVVVVKVLIGVRRRGGGFPGASCRLKTRDHCRKLSLLLAKRPQFCIRMFRPPNHGRQWDSVRW